MAHGKKVGRPSAYGVVKPKLKNIINWVSTRGMSMDGVAQKLGISRSTLFKLRNEHEEFRRALEYAHMKQETVLVGKLWELAMGDAIRTDTTTYGKGKDDEYTIEKTVQREPNRWAILALLKRYHGWGSIERSTITPVVVSGSDDAEERRRASILLGVEKPARDTNRLMDSQSLEVVDP